MYTTQTLTVSLALASLLIANPGFGDEITTVMTTEPATVNIDDASRERALESNKAAVELAAETILANTRLDLDIRLIGPTSVKIARDQ